MVSLPPGVVENATLEARNLRSRTRISTPDHSHGSPQRTSTVRGARTEVPESEQQVFWSKWEESELPGLIAKYGRSFSQIADLLKTKTAKDVEKRFQTLVSSGQQDLEKPAKRLKLSQETSVESKDPATSPTGPYTTTTSVDMNPNLLESSAPLSAKDSVEGKRRTWTLPKTKRASSLNLHNHPVIPHPVGIAIWLLQKIDQARKSTSSDDERSPSNSLPTSPSGVRPSTEPSIYGARVERLEPSSTFTIKPQSLTGAQPLWGQPHVSEHEDDTARRQAQRHRKTKQRSENWAKNKENDVVARAKLEAKKKYGTHPQQEMDRKRFVDERVRDDYGRLLGRQTAQFADSMAQLAPFRVGHSDDFVASNQPRFDIQNPYVQAGKLLLEVLPALAETRVSERSQKAADALLYALDHGTPDEGSFFSFIEVLSDDEIIQQGIDKVLGQLLNARPEDRRTSRSQAVPGGVQLASSAFGISSDLAGSSLRRITWKEPATLKDNNFAPPNNSVPASEARVNGQSKPPSTPSNVTQDPTPPPSQNGLIPDSSASAYITPSVIMPPPPPPPPSPPPAQARSSGRERKPTAKVLAAGAETPSRPSATLPSAASKPALTRHSRSVPRVPSKLGLSELVADQEGSAAASATPTAGQHQHTTSECTNPGNGKGDQRSLPATTSGPLIPAVVPRSLQQTPSNLSSNIRLQLKLDPQLTANLLQLAEIAANMSDSDDDELEMESNDLPYHERLIREFQTQSGPSKWHIAAPISMGQPTKLSNAETVPPASPSQTTSVNASTTPSTSLPPVNTIMSTKEAQAASSFFKSLTAGEPATNAQERRTAHSKAMSPFTNADKSIAPAHNANAGDATTNGNISAGRLSGARHSSLPQLPGPGAQKVHTDNKTSTNKTQLGGLSTNGHGTVLPQISQPEAQAARTRHTTMSPQQATQPLDKKRKFEHEAYDIAMDRLRLHAESRGLVTDPALNYDQLTAMIDDHDRKLASYTHRGANGPSMGPAPFISYTNGPVMNGNASYGSPGPSPTTERPKSSEALRRLAPSPAWPGYNSHNQPYNPLHPGSPAAQYSTSPYTLSYRDAQQSSNGLIANKYNKTYQFVTPKQPEQFSNRRSPVVEKPPSMTNGDGPKQHNQDALNGGPPGGGAVINSRTNKKAQTTNTANFKFHVNGKDPPIAQSQPKRGGQLMTF